PNPAPCIASRARGLQEAAGGRAPAPGNRERLMRQDPAGARRQAPGRQAGSRRMAETVFLVTGGSRGIGAAVAMAAAQAGHRVLLSYASAEDRALEVVARIGAAGGTARAVRADTADPAEVAALFAAADEMGPLAVLVC